MNCPYCSEQEINNHLNDHYDLNVFNCGTIVKNYDIPGQQDYLMEPYPTRLTNAKRIQSYKCKINELEQKLELTNGNTSNSN